MCLSSSETLMHYYGDINLGLTFLGRIATTTNTAPHIPAGSRSSGSWFSLGGLACYSRDTSFVSFHWVVWLVIHEIQALLVFIGWSGLLFTRYKLC